MMPSVPFYAILMQIVYALPSYVVYIVGIVFAVKYWSRAPRVGLVVTVTLGILLLTSAASTFSYMGYYFFAVSGGGGMGVFSTIMTLSGIARTIIHAGGWAVILWVLFGLVRELSEKQSAAGAVPGPSERRM